MGAQKNSLSTYNLPALVGPAFILKGSFYAHTLPATEGGIQRRQGGGGIIFGTDPVGVGHGSELATSSLEGLDIFYMHITGTRFVDWVRIYMNVNEHRCDKTCLQGFR